MNRSWLIEITVKSMGPNRRYTEVCECVDGDSVPGWILGPVQALTARLVDEHENELAEDEADTAADAAEERRRT